MKKKLLNISTIMLLSMGSAFSQEATNALYDYCKRAEVQTIASVTPYMTAAIVDTSVLEVIDRGVAVIPHITTIEAGETIAQKLSDFGFATDEINLGLVKSLNPNISNFDRIEAGAQVIVPRVDMLAASGDVPNKFTNSFDGYKASNRYVDIIASQAKQDFVASLNNGDVIDNSYVKQIEAAMSAAEEVQIFDNKATIAAMAENNVDLFTFDRSWGAIAMQPAAAAGLDFTSNGEIIAAYNQSAALYAGGTFGNIITVTVKTFEEGVAVDQLEIKYRSKMLDILNCPPEYARRFQTPSHEARHPLSTAYWVIWAEDATGRRSQSLDLDLTEILDSEYPKEFHIIWQEDNK